MACPPAIPIFRTSTVLLSRSGPSLIVKRVGEPDPLAWQTQRGRNAYTALYVDAARIVSTSVIALEDGAHVVELTGAFHRQCSGDEEETKRWIGPLPAADCALAVAAIERSFGLPRVPMRVDAATLPERMTELDGKLIEMTAVWRLDSHFEMRWFAGCNLHTSRHFVRGQAAATYTVVGFYAARHPLAAPYPGGSPLGTIEAISITQ